MIRLMASVPPLETPEVSKYASIWVRQALQTRTSVIRWVGLLHHWASSGGPASTACPAPWWTTVTALSGVPRRFEVAHDVEARALVDRCASSGRSFRGHD